MSFIINQNFDLKSPQFNFARDYFDNIAKLKAANENDFPDHFITNVAGELYQLNKSYTPNDTTGKWRKLKLGSDIDLSGYATTASLNNHTTNKSNPHGVTKSQVGLGNVDNTSDAAKPVSAATQTALDSKANKNKSISTLTIGAHKNSVNIGGTFEDGGLITTLNIPLAEYQVSSDAEDTQKAGLITGAERKRLDALGLSGDSFNDNITNTKGLELSLNGTNTSVKIGIVKPSDSDATYGLMSGKDKTKLDNVEKTYAKKSDVSALTSALVYKGTIGTNGTITKLNVAAKVGDVYVAVAGAPAVNGVALEAGDMIIAKTAGDGTNTQPTWTAIQTNINGAVTSTNALADNTLILGNNNRAIKASSGIGFVKVINGAVSYNNDVVTTSDTLGASKLIIGKGNKNIQTASGTGFVKIADGVVLADNSTYLKSVSKATTSAVGGGKVVNVYSETAAITNTDPEASNVTLYGLQIDKDGNFYTPVKNADAYSLPTASNTVLGGIKTGFTKNDSAKNYPVELSGDKAYVHVPWTDTNTTYTADGVYVTLTSGQFSLAHDKKTLIDNAIQPDNIEDEDGILTYDKFGYLYHQIKTDLSDKYVCKDLVKSYVSVRIIQHDAPIAGGANMTGALVFCASAPATNEGVYTGKFGQYQTGSTGNIYSNDVTWALDAATDLIVVDQNGNEYTVTSGTSVTLTPRAIQTSAITKLF